jgi:hypothetical protein
VQVHKKLWMSPKRFLSKDAAMTQKLVAREWGCKNMKVGNSNVASMSLNTQSIKTSLLFVRNKSLQSSTKVILISIFSFPLF